MYARKIRVPIFLLLLCVFNNPIYADPFVYGLDQRKNSIVIDSSYQLPHNNHSSLTSVRYSNSNSVSHYCMQSLQFDPIVNYSLDQQNQRKIHSQHQTAYASSPPSKPFTYCDPLICTQLYNDGLKNEAEKNKRFLEESATQLAQKTAHQVPFLQELAIAYAYNNTHERYQNRYKAIEEVIERPECSYKIHVISDVAKVLIEENPLADYADLVLNFGNQLQQVIHGECVEIVNQLGEEVDQHHITGSLKDVVDVAVNYTAMTCDLNKNTQIPQAIKCADVAWSLLEYTKALAVGMGTAVVNITNGVCATIIHPVETVKAIARVAEIAAIEIADFIFTCSEMSVYAHVGDMAKMDEISEKLVHKVYTITDYIDKEFLQLSRPKKVEGIATIVTEFFLPGYVFKIMKGSNYIARLQANVFAQAGNVFNKAHALVEAPLAVAYAKTHDMMRLAQKYGQQNLQKAIEIFKANKAGFIITGRSCKKTIKKNIQQSREKITLSEINTIEKLIEAAGELEKIERGKQGFIYGLDAIEVLKTIANNYRAEVKINEYGKPFFKIEGLYIGFHESTLGKGCPSLHINHSEKKFKIRFKPCQNMPNI